MSVPTKRRTSNLRSGFGFWLLAIIFALLPATQGLAAEKLRIAVLKYGTVNWVMDVIKENRLDAAEGFELEVVGLAGKQASMVALQSGNVDVAVTDWIWVSRQRNEGRPYTFVPYSNALGELVVHQDSPISSLDDLRGKRLGIAGGPLDKSWLLIRALSLKQSGQDLADEVMPVFAAPPLLNQQMKQRRIDAIINYWPYVARLHATGMRRLLSVRQASILLGITGNVPLVGYVFDERWAERNKPLLTGFLRAASEANELLRAADAEWDRLRPLMKAPEQATFEALKQGFRAGIPERRGYTAMADAEKLFSILRSLGGSRLVGDAGRLAAGTFWPEVWY